MKTIVVDTMGYSVNFTVPDSIEEYNALAPKRDNPVLEDAIKYQILHGTNSVFRSKLTEATGKEAALEQKDDESDGTFYKRIIASSGLSTEDFTARHAGLAQELYSKIPFDPSLREPSAEGPAIGKRDKALAEELIKRGDAEVARVAALLASKLGRAVGTEVNDLARAFADNRRAQAAAAELARKAELGI